MNTRDQSLRYIDQRFRDLAKINPDASPREICEAISREAVPGFITNGTFGAYRDWLLALSDYRAKRSGATIATSDYSHLPLFKEES